MDEFIFNSYELHEQIACHSNLTFLIDHIFRKPYDLIFLSFINIT